MNGKTITAVVVSAFALYAVAEPIALYTCEDGVVGETVTTLTNRVNPSLYGGTAHQRDYLEAKGAMPVWTNNVIGNCVYSDSACTSLVARLPKAICFSKAPTNDNAGAYIDFAGLGKALCAKKKFTIEFFWRQSAFQTYTKTICLINGCRITAGTFEGGAVGLDGRYATSGYFQNRRRVDLVGNWDNYLNKNGWRHWAITYDMDNDIAEFYNNYILHAALTNSCKWSVAQNDLRFGSAIANTGSPTPTGVSPRGELTCLRVSEGVLGVDEFMRMGPSVFYPFKDGSKGETVTTVTNAVVGGTFTGNASVNRGSLVFSDDRPGRYLYASSRRDVLLCENPGSLNFVEADSWSPALAQVIVEELGGRIDAHIATRYPALTIECFFKKDGRFNWGNLPLVSFSGSKRFYFKDNDSSLVCNQDDFSGNMRSVSNEGESFLKDGLWHHAAIVFSASDDSNKLEWKNGTIYLDYSRAASDGDFSFFISGFLDNLAKAITIPLYIGRSCSGKDNSPLGKIGPVRIVPAALKPEQFMVASDTTALPDNETFRWRFEEGKDKDNLTAASDSVSGEVWAKGTVKKFGAATKQPTYAADRAARRIKTGDILETNRISAAFAELSLTNRVVLQNHVWSGLPALHPKSWTFEAFAKPAANVTRAKDVLLFGHGRLNPTSGAEWRDFALVLQPNGQLGFKGSCLSDGGDETAINLANIGSTWKDGRWNSFAVTYDGDTRTLVVWSNGTKANETTLDGDLADSLKGRWQVASGCGEGSFAGLMDEIRLSPHVKNDLQEPYKTFFYTIFR